jgi:hygromycin-B 7''-O-kinase
MKRDLNLDLAGLPGSESEHESSFRSDALWEPIARQVLHALGCGDVGLARPPRASNVVYRVNDTAYLKIFDSFQDTGYESEVVGLLALQGLSVPTPSLLAYGELTPGWTYLYMTALEGQLLEQAWPTMGHPAKVELMRQLGALVREVHTLPIENPRVVPNWSELLPKLKGQVMQRHERTQLPAHLRQQLPGYIQRHEPLRSIRANDVWLTGEYTPENLLVTNVGGSWRLSGMFDFGDLMMGPYEYDLLGPIMFYAAGDPALLSAFFDGYGLKREELTSQFLQRLLCIALLHRFSDFKRQICITGWERCEDLESLANYLWKC